MHTEDIMDSELGMRNYEEHDLLVRHSKILQELNRISSVNSQGVNHNETILKCGEILLRHSNYSAVGICRHTIKESELTSLGLLLPTFTDTVEKAIYRREVSLEQYPRDLINRVLNTCAANKTNNFLSPLITDKSLFPVIPKSCGVWPLIFQDHFYGIFVIYSNLADGFNDRESAFLDSSISDMAHKLYSHDVSAQLQLERDFNTEIIDTIQALMVSITPCGKIFRFNPEAEKVTGYKEKEVIDAYWVDILLSPDNRLAYQKLVSDLLSKNIGNINFRAELETKEGTKRTIEWHSSIKPDIDEGTVGMVLFGLDITEQLMTDKAYNSALARFENIFSTIQDPAIIATKKGIILDANHATFSASRKSRKQVIGQTVCKILHGSTSKDHKCSLEKLLRMGKSRIIHTDLVGLHGDYLLTLSPCRSENTSEEVTLIVARDTTEEEQLKAEAIRAAQLASIGELAAGVAHEINNPINGILNYTQMLQDLALDRSGLDITRRIISESRRIEGIVRNLLDFSRNRIEAPEPVCSKALIDDCIMLVGHQMQKEDIVIETDFPDQLPLTFCNASQIKQVILNILSNSRYALNHKYQKPDVEKIIAIKSLIISRKAIPYLRLIITDHGTGIEHQVLDRIFDPFFSTKPNGEGTGLGLSISYGLIRDNNGHIKISSEQGRFTATTIDLPIVNSAGEKNDA